jgi:hypothetical protein
VNTVLSPGQLHWSSLGVGLATIGLILVLERTRVGALGLVVAVVVTCDRAPADDPVGASASTTSTATSARGPSDNLLTGARPAESPESSEGPHAVVAGVVGHLGQAERLE